MLQLVLPPLYLILSSRSKIVRFARTNIHIFFFSFLVDLTVWTAIEPGQSRVDPVGYQPAVTPYPSSLFGQSTRIPLIAGPLTRPPQGQKLFQSPCQNLWPPSRNLQPLCQRKPCPVRRKNETQSRNGEKVEKPKSW